MPRYLRFVRALALGSGLAAGAVACSDDEGTTGGGPDAARDAQAADAPAADAPAADTPAADTQAADTQAADAPAADVSTDVADAGVDSAEVRAEVAIEAAEIIDTQPPNVTVDGPLPPPDLPVQA